MRAWAAKATGRRRESYCEQCGAAGAIRSERQVADRPRRGELLVCQGCSLLTCPACWPGPFLTCRKCTVRQDPVLVALVGEAPPRRAEEAVAAAGPPPARARPVPGGVLAAAAVVVLAVIGGVIALARPGGGTGGVAGVTATSSPTSPPASVAATAEPSRAPTGTVDPAEPSPSPVATPRPIGPANLVVTSSVIRPWVDALGEVRAQVLVGVTNDGGAPGYVPSAATAWDVLTRDGFVVSQGRFAHVFPRLVEPGSTAWLVDTVSATFAEPGDLDDLSVTLDEREPTTTDLAEADTLTVTDVAWRVDDAGSLSVSGVVRNVSSRPIARWSAGVVLVAADGTPIAAAYEIGEVDALAPGETARFLTSYPGSGPVEEDDVATAVAVAVPLD